MIFKRAPMRTVVTSLTAAILSAVLTGALAGFLAGFLAWIAPANASEIDLSTWTCKQFQAAGKDEVALILAWLDGYYRAEDDPPVIDTSQLAANSKKLDAYCAAHPDSKLITAADTLFERE
jgi:acid stress chaperone HdeB